VTVATGGARAARCGDPLAEVVARGRDPHRGDEQCGGDENGGQGLEADDSIHGSETPRNQYQ
jgi:hypothetical protein